VSWRSANYNCKLYTGCLFLYCLVFQVYKGSLWVCLPVNSQDLQCTDRKSTLECTSVPLFINTCIHLCMSEEQQRQALSSKCTNRQGTLVCLACNVPNSSFCFLCSDRVPLSWGYFLVLKRIFVNHLHRESFSQFIDQIIKWFKPSRFTFQ